MQTCHLHFPAKLTGKVPDHIWRGQWVTLWVTGWLRFSSQTVVMKDLPGGPVVKSLPFQCRETRV